MTRRTGFGLLAALVLAGCGGSAAVEPEAPTPATAKPVATPAGVQPTPEQLAFREQLLESLRDGTYVACTCTAEIRAKERVASGKVKPPPAAEMASALP